MPGGIGEEDFLTLVLPYIKTAREGVERLGALLEEFGTYEMNGVAFSDVDEIWWLETVGGHHWIAKRVPDEAYVTMPNQLGIDEFDLEDALGDQEEHMCSADLGEFIARNHLDLSVENTTPFNPRDAFGSHSDSDHVYNTPRAWYMQRFLNPYDEQWDGPDADHKPTADDIPWARQPERKITIEDVKYVLSSHYQGTPYDPYGKLGDQRTRHMFRPIGINRQSQLAVMQIRPYRPQVSRAIQWMAYGSNPFNTLVPFFPNVDSTPKYLEDTTVRVTSENFYWENRIIAALCDASFADTANAVERYQEKTVWSQPPMSRSIGCARIPISTPSSMQMMKAPTCSRWNRMRSSKPPATRKHARFLPQPTGPWPTSSRRRPTSCSTPCSTRRA